MSANSLLDNLRLLIEPLLASLGLELWGMEFLPGGRAILRIYIEKNINGVPADAGIDECAQASRLVGMTLEVEDIIPHAYILEVSTPGLDRAFFTPAQLSACLRRPVDLALRESVPEYPGRKHFTGIITKAAIHEGDWIFTFIPLNIAEMSPPMQDAAVNDTEISGISFGWTDIKKARLIYMPPEKPGPPVHGKNSAEQKKNKKN